MEEDSACRDDDGGGPRSGGGGADLISSLPDDVIILVLVRLRCARAAARTSLLARRWRGLWTRLPDLIFRKVVPSLLLAALSSLIPGGTSLSLLDIHVPANLVSDPRTGQATDVSSLLCAAAWLSPATFRFNHSQQLVYPYVDLSTYFHRATSIELHATSIQLYDKFLGYVHPRFELPELQSLSLYACRVNLADLVPRCPRLRVLRLADAYEISIHSASLEELVVENNVIELWTGRVHVETPVLKRLTMFLRTRGDLCVSISVPPLVEKVSWRCLYSGAVAGLGVWGLLAARLETDEESNVQQGDQDARPRARVLCLHMFARYPINYRGVEAGFATEIEKHMVTDFSGLEVHLTTPHHVFGAFLLRLLALPRIRTAVRRLKIVLQRSEMKDICTPLVNCSCDEPKNWRTQTISLTTLEKVEIQGFEGEDHEFDFLKLIFRCAPMLERVSLQLSEGFTPNDDWCTKIHHIFMAYPSLECTIDHSPGSFYGRQTCAST
uniref:Uncharacterized protein n=1 Tax=Avena sativa TaxID=4498 RepID=A0ACD5TSQ1_AVESA